MSGGVDSSVVALLMKRLSDSMSDRGDARLILKPVYMRNWSTLEESGSFEPGSGGAAGCEWQKEFEAVQQVCKALHLPEPRLVDLTKEYWRDVFEPSLDMWQAGQTPNPDVVCNQVIKFGALLDRLIPPQARQNQQHADQKKSWLATGHYGRLIYPEGQTLPQLHQALDLSKDQTYFLSAVSADQFAHALFPIADLLKTQTKQLARDAALPTAAAKESMGLCFVGKRDTRTTAKTPEEIAAEETFRQANKSIPSPNRPSFGRWLSSFVSDKSPYTRPGVFVDVNLKTLGRHDGLHTLTIGQSSRIPGLSEKHFVARKDVVDGLGLAIIVPGKDHPMLQCTAIRIAANHFHWVNDTDEARIAVSSTPVKMLARTRYLEVLRPCHVTIIQATDVPCTKILCIRFDESAGVALPTAASAGQVLALYDGTRCLGSGVIPLDEGGVGIELKQSFTYPDSQ